MRKFKVLGLVLSLAVLAAFLAACSNPAGPGGNRTQNQVQTPPTDNFTPVPSQYETVAAQLEWIRDNAQTGGTYVVWARADENIPADAAGIIGSNILSTNITVRIRSYGATTPPPPHELTLTGGAGSMLTVQAGHTLYLQDIILTGDNANNASLVRVTGGHLRMQNAVIRNNRAFNGGGVNVTNGTFTMNNGSIIYGNTAVGIGGGINNGGGGVFLDNSALTMNSGAVIHSNGTPVNSGHGGGVNARNNSIVNMTGTALIGGPAGQENYARHVGGGVFLHNSELNMYNDAAIIGNRTSHMAGGVYVHQTSTVRMRGANTRINDNIANTIGGLRINSSGGRLFIYNGEIYGNTPNAIEGTSGIHAFGRWDSPNPGWNQEGLIVAPFTNIRVENGTRTL